MSTFLALVLKPYIYQVNIFIKFIKLFKKEKVYFIFINKFTTTSTFFNNLFNHFCILEISQNYFYTYLHYLILMNLKKKKLFLERAFKNIHNNICPPKIIQMKSNNKILQLLHTSLS